MIHLRHLSAFEAEELLLGCGGFVGISNLDFAPTPPPAWLEYLQGSEYLPLRATWRIK